jgi:nicotinamide riboside kinase
MSPGTFKIALLGPESTGKSTLAAALADYFGTGWVPEFARSYLPTLTHEYTEADVLHCAKEQRNLEDAACRATTARLLFFDTDMINLSVWLEYRFSKAPDWLTKELKSRYDFYLLTTPDLPFEPDPLREHPDLREYFFDKYRQAIHAAGIPYQVIEGVGKQRFENARRAVEKALSTEIE